MKNFVEAFLKDYLYSDEYDAWLDGNAGPALKAVRNLAVLSITAFAVGIFIGVRLGHPL